MFQLPRLSEIRGLVHAISTKKEGNQSFGFGDQAKVVLNRQKFLAAMGRDPEERWPLGSCVSMVPKRNGFKDIAFVGPERTGLGMTSSENGPFCEAMITTATTIRLYITIADCIPIIVYDPVCRVLTLVHAGRESTASGIVRRVIEAMARDHGSKPRQLIVGLGPGIRRESYRLEKFPSALESDSPWREFCRVTPTGVRVDLFGFNRKALADVGVPANRIVDCGIDTFASRGDFFSHRRSAQTGEKEGRHACVVGMVE